MNRKFLTLFETLGLLGIKINNHFDESFPFGYHKNIQLNSSNKYKFFINQISENEIIISDKPLMLGRERCYIENGYQVRTYYSLDDWIDIKSAYQNIKEIKAVPKMIFPKDKVIFQKIIRGETLLNSKVLEIHKKKLIEFIKKMNQFGYAHRDLHCKNIIVSSDDVFVIDWDFVTKQSCDLLFSYDLTGNGLPSPHLTNNCHIFKSFPIIGVPSVADLLNIKLEDFI